MDGDLPDESRETFKEIVIKSWIRWILADFNKDTDKMLCRNLKERRQGISTYRHDTHHTCRQLPSLKVFTSHEKVILG
jgi:hypothetical protein